VHCGVSCTRLGNNVYCAQRSGAECNWFGSKVYCGINCTWFGNDVYCAE
jgi:hypothetical protein